MTLRMDSRQQLDLSGAWQIAFDPESRGLADGWATGNWPPDRASAIQVPAIWNIEYPDADGVGFYRKTFTVPSDWQNQVVQLHCEGASYRVEVWLNGSYAGNHEGAYTPFWFDATRFIKAGAENELVVRVAALSRKQNTDGIVLQQSPASKQNWYYAYGGLWGKVYLETRPWVSLQAVFIEPDLERATALIEVVLNNRRFECRPPDLQLHITAPDDVLAFEQSSRVIALPGVTRHSYRVHLPRPCAWSCEHPHLYRLQIKSRDDQGESDNLSTTFGMRDFTVRDGEFFLNGEAMFLRGALLQPNFPVNLVTPPDREMMVREITLMKEAGLNLIRAHIRPAPPGYLDLTDQIGMLVYAETSLGWIKESPRVLDHGRREVQALIERDRNHPSVVFWGIFNENPTMSKVYSDALVPWARTLDPTRVVVDNSGGTMAIDQDFGWIDRATVLPNRATERQKILDVHLYLGGFVTPPVYEWMRTLGSGAPSDVIAAHDFASSALLSEFDREQRTYRGKVFVSELGCAGMSDLEETVARFGGREDLLDARELKIFRDGLREGFQKHRLDRIFGSTHRLAEEAQGLHAAGNTRQIEALLGNPRVSGYVLTQLNDVAWEFHAGLLDLWRNPKRAYHAVKRLNQSHCVILKAESPVATTCSPVRVTLTLVNRLPLQGDEQVLVAASDPSENQVATRIYKAAPGAGIQELGTIAFDTGVVAGEYRVLAKLVRGDETLAESSETILTLAPVEWTEESKTIELVGSAPELPFSSATRTENQSRLMLVAQPASLSEAEWNVLLNEVEQGRVAIIGALHKRDERARLALANRGVKIELHHGIGSWMGCYHWIPRSDLFADLPANGLAGEPYIEVLPWYALSEQGGEILAGLISNTQTRLTAASILWFSDIEAVPFGQGTMIFCQYRIFDKLKTNPLAARLAFNLIQQAHIYSSDQQRTQ